MADRSEGEALQQSWVEVDGQKETLTHTSSQEEMKQLLASAASEEELSAMDNDQMYQVTFHATEDSDEEDNDNENPPIKLRSSSQVPHEKSHGQGICSLTFLFPVIILTHLAMFGIGYYLGRRWSADASSTVMKVFHV